jgi:carbonic anhydrase
MRISHSPSMHTRRFLILLALAVPLPLVVSSTRAAHSLSAAFEGESQSPIDLRAELVELVPDRDLADLKFRYPVRVDLAVENTGETVRADVPAGAAELRVGRETYALLQFHVHTPSEHLLDGAHAPAELHLVHASATGELMVVGVFLEEGGASALGALLEAAPEEEGHGTELHDFPLRTLLPRDLSSYRYDGSLTTPPFTEGVRWAVLAEPAVLPESTLERLHELFPEGNAREVQPLAERTIVSDLEQL